MSETIKTKKIDIRLTPEEYEIIQKKSEISGKTASRYCREILLNGFIIQYDYDAIIAHTEQISQLRNDLENISKIMEKIWSEEKKMLQKLQKNRSENIKKTQHTFTILWNLIYGEKECGDKS